MSKPLYQQPQPEAEKNIDPNPLYDYLVSQQQYEFAEQVRTVFSTLAAYQNNLHHLAEALELVKNNIHVSLPPVVKEKIIEALSRIS